MSNEPQYCAIFGDIIGSRMVMERSELQNQLLTTLARVNCRLGDRLVAPFRFVAGDEIRGLLADESESYAAIRMFQSGIFPYRMRFALGIGEVSTDLSSDIGELDGSALHRASSAMLLLKSKKRSHGRAIYFCSADAGRDSILNALTFLIGSIRSSWTPTMAERVELLSSGLTLTEVGERLGVSHQAVRNSIVNADYYALTEGEALLNSLLQDCSTAALQ